MPYNNHSLNSSAIAIIGFAFRFPNDYSDENELWTALKEGKNFLGKIPPERWATDELQHHKRSEPGRSITFSAGVLSKIDEFDANFFGISPREAAWIDPQQRLLLELAWEAMENAHVKPSSLAGSDCAVYVGISGLDYGTRGQDDLSSLTSHIMTGNTLSIAANRLSYSFDLHGPSLSIDTACSSSLVALHHACQTLQAGEASSALVGGVNMLLHPYPFIGFTKASMLSADGLCKTFDASGNGYVRSEGGVVLLIKPLQKAIDDGDDIQAVILATGSNADGARKSGITIPSKEGQVELMKSVLAKTNLSTNEIDFIEAHGTGTSIGDPIETAAIGEVYGKNRHTPLPIGSIKANLGHMEPASGMAGLIKTILSLKNRALVPQIHLNTPNPQIDFLGLNIQPVTQYTSLSQEEHRPLVAGVNSFGFGGTNAHILIQEYSPNKDEKQKKWSGVIPPLFLSARTDAALKAMAAQYVLKLQDTTDSEYYDLAYEAAYRRDKMQKHLAVMAKTPHEVREKLEIYSRGDDCQGIIFEEDLPQKGSIAFIYSGNGAQWIGMGLRLMAESPRFAKIMQELDLAMQPVAGFSILNELNKDSESSQMDDTIIAQPLLFALQVALTKMLKEFGIQPTAVSGHSVGEVAAAWACGALDLESAIRVIVARSTAQGTTRGTGRMAAVGLSEKAFKEQLTILDEEMSIAIAGINSPNNITISGSLIDLNRLQSFLEPKGIFFRVLDLDYAFHSYHMDPIEKMLIEGLHDLKPSSKEITFVSTVTGQKCNGESLDAKYWWHNVREPVRFGEAISVLSELGCHTFIEIAPHAILQRYISETLSHSNAQGRVLPTLRKNNDGLDSLIESIIRAHLSVETPDLKSFFPIQGNHIKVPNYPWQRERHWHPKTAESLLSLERRRVHPLLGWRIPEADLSWENTIDPVMFPWLEDHKVGGAVVFPGAGYAEMALAAAREWTGNTYVSFEDLDIVSPMVFDGEHARSLRLELHPRDGSFYIKSRQRLSHDEWSLHAVGRIIELKRKIRQLNIEIPSHYAHVIDQKSHYAMAKELGLGYGPSFQGLKEAFVYENSVEVKLDVPLNLREEGYGMHPALLDVCYQSLVDFYHHDIQEGKGSALLPIRTAKMEVYPGNKIASFRARLNRQSARSVVVDFEIFDTQGELVASLFGCRFRAAPLTHAKIDKIARWQTSPWLEPHPQEALSISFAPIDNLFDIAKSALKALHDKRQQWFQEIFPLLDALVLSFVFEAFQNTQLSTISASADPYVKWLKELLKREEMLLEKNNCITLVNESELPPAKEIWQTILAEYPESLTQLTLLGRIGTKLPEVLNGHLHRQKLYDSIKDAPAIENMYSDDPTYSGIQCALRHILKELSKQNLNHRLRILEISAGFTELPLELLETHLEDHLDYVLALPDQTTVDRQHAEYANFNNLSIITLPYDEWTLLDSSDMLSVTFDIIILNHTLHKVHHINPALQQLKNRLSVGGCLFVAERYPDWSADLLFGLDAQWWHKQGTEDMVFSSLLTPSAWEKLLCDAGLETVECLTESTADEISVGSYLIAAKNLRHTQLNQEVLEPQSWLLLVDEASQIFGEHLALLLKSSNHHVSVTHQLPRENTYEFNHLLYLQGWETLPQETTELLANALETVQNLASMENAPRLWLITRGGALVSELNTSYPINPVQSALCGFGRVVMNEYPSLGCTLLDVACDLNVPGLLSRLKNELLRPDGSHEIIVTPHARYTIAMHEEGENQKTYQNQTDRFYLDFHVPGQLNNLVWLPQKMPVLKHDEIEIHVQATGLNFRDVMYLMGLLPDEALENGFAGASLGLEFSGYIVNLGSSVKHMHMGDRVMGFGASCFASHVVTRADAVAKMPEKWSYASAATVPTVFFTVYYALKHLADLQANETVLIHGGAGGVGIAAIQLAKYLGAKVFATAGSDDKRAFVKLLGANRVFDSRSLSFAEDILVATEGKGIDVVLNSLAGEAIRRNLAILKPFGRFLELGKRDFFENTPIGLRPFRNNISYFGIDADQILTVRPQLAARLFTEVMELFYNGFLSPLPCRIFNANRIVDAFRFMQQSRHIGKVVVSYEHANPKVPTHMPARKQPVFSKTFTWLVTGGISGFGLESARWLVSCGVRHLVLVSRSGLKAPHAQDILNEFQAQGIKLEIVACDIADADAVCAMMTQIEETMPPLQGLIHAAALYEDTLLHNLDANKINKVIQPKFIGAWNLHQATYNLSLEYFILYSSVTVSIGNPGQANYVAANAALESLARMRRQQGLAATCISWGPIGDAGYLMRNTDVLDSLSERMGRKPLSSQQALRELGYHLPNDAIIADFDWSVLSRLLPSSGHSRFRVLNRALKNSKTIDDEIDFRTLIIGKSAEEISLIVRQYVTNEVAQILAINAERIEPLRSLHDMGLDSLMAVELALGLEQRIGVQLPVMMLNDSPTVEKVTRIIVQKVLMATDNDGVSSNTTHTIIEAIAKQHGDLVSNEALKKIADETQKILKCFPERS